MLLHQATNTILLIQTLHLLGSRCEDLVRNIASREYCETDVFQPTCYEGEVIVMTTATYGRMKVGRCVKKSLGYVGCHTNVLHLADSRCSGLVACELRLPDPLFDKTKPCLEELKTYMDASYDCVRVMRPPKPCSDGNQWVITNRQGYLSPSVTTTSNCGSPLSPIVIHSLPGQRINITLLSFNVASHAHARDGGYDNGRNCHPLGLIIDKVGGKRISVCRGSERKQHVYLSRNNSIELTLRRATDPGIDVRFLLHYKVTGCRDIAPPSGAWIRRSETEAEIGCYATREVWTLFCNDGDWIGSTGNCSIVAAADARDHSVAHMPLPQGVSVIIIISIALGIGVVVLLCGICLFKRLRKRADHDNAAIDFQAADMDVEELEQLKVNYDNEHKVQVNADILLQQAFYEKTYKDINGYTPMENMTSLTPDVVHIRKPEVAWKISTLPPPGECSERDQSSAAAAAAASAAELSGAGGGHFCTFKEPIYSQGRSCRMPVLAESSTLPPGSREATHSAAQTPDRSNVRKSLRSVQDPLYDRPCMHRSRIARNPRNIYESRRLGMPYNLNNSF